MQLKITDTSLPAIFPEGATVSLSNNGADEIRILDIEHSGYFGVIENASIQFHADDEKTSFTLRGFVCHHRAHYTRVSITVE